MKALASLSELRSPDFEAHMAEINRFAGRYGLRQITQWSKIWEYPWIRRHVEERIHPASRVLDIGSELSPMPWWWATRGATVRMVETNSEHVSLWAEVRDRLAAEGCIDDVQRIDWRIVADHELPFERESFDIVTSFSVIEHMADKAGAFAEAARVLRRGGWLALSFDICEPERGMTFPEWNGDALTMAGFDDLVAGQRGLALLDPVAGWNTDDIPDFLAWHRTTAPHHNYVVGAAVLVKK